MARALPAPARPKCDSREAFVDHFTRQGRNKPCPFTTWPYSCISLGLLFPSLRLLSFIPFPRNKAFCSHSLCYLNLWSRKQATTHLKITNKCDPRVLVWCCICEDARTSGCQDEYVRISKCQRLVSYIKLCYLISYKNTSRSARDARLHTLAHCRLQRLHRRNPHLSTTKHFQSFSKFYKKPEISPGWHLVDLHTA